MEMGPQAEHDDDLGRESQWEPGARPDRRPACVPSPTEGKKSQLQAP